jgi:hypothetical protein
MTLSPEHAPWKKEGDVERVAIKLQNKNIYIEPVEEVVDIHNNDISPLGETPQIYGDTGDHEF